MTPQNEPPPPPPPPPSNQHLTVQTSLPTQSLSHSQPPLPPPPPPPPLSSRSRGLRTPNLDYVENVTKYRPGGFCPVDLGDVLDGKYKVVHKLGNGGFATVWLARVLEEQQYVAIKIPRADASTKEISILMHLRSVASHLSIAKLLDAFTITGPNGVHNSLVLEVGGPDLRAITELGKRLPIPFVRSAARQLAECVAGLHAVGVCHGDLIYSNVLFKIKSLQQWSEEEFYHHLGKPETEKLLQYNGDPPPANAPTEVVSAITYSNFDIGLLSGDIRITDFGEAFFANTPPANLGTPPSYFAPELLFGYKPSPASDIWALGCLIFEMHTGRIFAPSGLGTLVEALGMSVEALGALPEAWMDSWCDKDRPITSGPGKDNFWFDEKRERGRLLEGQLRKAMPELEREELGVLLDLLRGMLVFEPERRLSAAEVVGHAWFRRV